MPQSLPDFSLDDHHDIPFESDMLVMWRETLRQGKPYRGTTSPDSPHVFPDDEMGFFKARGIRSLISVPIFLGETWWGAIGFSDCFQEREWLDVETDALIVAAGLLSAAIQRQQSDEALREREALYRKAITAADAVPYYQDYSQQRFVFIGDRIEELCGYSPQELTPSLWNSLILEVVPMGEGAEFAMQEAVLRARSGLAACWKCDCLIRTKSSQERWVADTSVEILGGDNRSYGSIGILQDITERKLAETAQQKAVEALRQRDNILETVAYAAETFLRAPDWESHIDEVLERLGREIGSCHTYIYQVERAEDARLLLSARFEYVTREELRDIGDPRFTHVPIEKFGTRPWLDAMLRGKPYYGSLKTLPPEDASLLIEYKVKSYLDVPILVGDQLWGLIGFENTIEEHEWSEAEIDSLIVAASVLAAAIQRQRTDQAIRQLNLELEQRVLERTAELESANRELESFAYSVSHDLRAPLRAIDGYSRFLAEDYAANLDDTGREYIENVRKATSQMGNLIDDLLKLSRVTRAEMHCEAVDLTRLSAELLDELRLGEAGRQMETIIQPGMQAYGDASLLRLALGNLIGNAWKFSGRKSQAVIEITAEQTDGRTVFSIRDNGVGFDMRYHDKLFLPFQRLHSLIDFEGTGVGLATVQRVIQRHSGQIWAEGRVGEGATFYFTLPAQS